MHPKNALSMLKTQRSIDETFFDA